MLSNVPIPIDTILPEIARDCWRPLKGHEGRAR
jgi:hypothetical protein